MKEWRQYQCEGHDSWEVLTHIDSNIETCPDGYEPVMIIRSKPSDRLVVSIVPLAREMDSISKKIGLSNLYVLELVSLIDDFRMLSQKRMEKEEAISIATMLTGLERKAALRVWKAKKL